MYKRIIIHSKTLVSLVKDVLDTEFIDIPFTWVDDIGWRYTERQLNKLLQHIDDLIANQLEMLHMEKYIRFFSEIKTDIFTIVRVKFLDRTGNLVLYVD